MSRRPRRHSLPAASRTLARLGTLATLALQCACTPKYDWRSVQGSNAPYTVLLPAKASTLTRTINLGGIQAGMTMTAAEVDDVTFAVGSAELADPAQAQAVLSVMKETMVRNVGGVVLHEKSATDATGTHIELDTGAGPAAGAAGNSAGARVLHARFIARQRRVYQVIVVGPEKAMRTDAIDTFLTSFKLE